MEGGMGKYPRNPKDIFPEITDDYKGLFGDELISIVLYGSATGSAYIPGKSDINFMIILSESAIEQLDRAFKTVEKWQKRKVAVPLFLTEVYVETSLDVYPIEYLNFQRNHRLVYGKDILRDLRFNPDLVRLQCEREIKGKLLLLRKSYVETCGRKRALHRIVAQSIPAFVAIFEALLFLEGKDPLTEKRDTVKAVGEAFGLNAALFEKLMDIKEHRIKPDPVSMNTLFKDYLGEVRKLSKLVDRWGG
jgi:hypothetical protein